ncbi:hypothetical protein LCGC14_0848580 [marine sediment metagenome]|uniref:Uncharacterized protein n=1 Tax=marine sediment metagenome TaxID=412755 RepID=A0A0F9PW92_9ZZZZ
MGNEFKVLKIDELSRVSETGGLERYYRHQIKTAGGVVLTVNISEKDFTPDKAAPILSKKAIEADKILKL